MLCSSLRTARSANLVCSLERFFKPEQTTTRRNGAFRERVAWGRRQGGHDRADVPRAYVPRDLFTAARHRRLAPAHTLGAGVRAIALFFAVAVLLGVQSGAEDLAAARTRLLAEAQITPIFVFAIFFFAVAVVRGIVPGSFSFF